MRGFYFETLHRFILTTYWFLLSQSFCQFRGSHQFENCWIQSNTMRRIPIERLKGLLNRYINVYIILSFVVLLKIWNVNVLQWYALLCTLATHRFPCYSRSPREHETNDNLGITLFIRIMCYTISERPFHSNKLRNIYWESNAIKVWLYPMLKHVFQS